MSSYYDLSGFSKQTTTVLHGLGVPELIPECKKRNISTNALHRLTVQELIILGLDPKKAEEVQNSLNIKKEKSCIIVTNTECRVEQFLDIIKNGGQQFSLMQALMSYCRLKLTKATGNIFTTENQCLNASDVLPFAVNATLTEVQETKRKLSELERLILGLKVKSKTKAKCNNIRQACIYISGLGLLTLVLFKICMT